MVTQGRIAHFNAARLKAMPGDPSNTFKINAIAERSAGFGWRLADEDALVALGGYQGPAGDPRVVYSLSVWNSLADFEQFVYKTAHGAFFRRRTDWFEPWGGPNYVIWDFSGPVPVAAAEGWQRLQQLTDVGPTHDAYDLAYAKAARRIRTAD